MPPRLVPDHVDACVIAAAPMQRQLNVLVIRDSHDDLREHAAQDAFADFRPRCGMGPCLLEIMAKLHQPFSFRRG